MIDEVRQPPLQFLALGDVLQLRDEVQRPVPVVANEGDGQQHPELVTLSVHVAFFDLIARQVAAYEPDDLTGIEVDVCGMRQFAQRTMLEMLPRKTRNPAERLVHSQQTPVHVDERHADRRVGERMLERMHH